ncbi:ceroid-lipofuscinosis neuronal protein 5 [Xyrichtys novacula]|uniref:Bis(monoacylglycero)phosphate synthase CLN5 n=1 Tax=Xyrichtys novacula TaxID=13765 RepID=A0AAV1H2V0_XYRNO|nr:ceroid-lipofuscinosis neuronal protein 5 [Xyrichtys novacula]
MTQWEVVVGLIVLLFLQVLAQFRSHGRTQWPVPYRRFDHRPDVDSYCEALYPFCPTGDRDGRITCSQIPEVYAPFWCNQGAACFFDGIDDLHWSQNGTLEKIGEITGDQFNDLAQWIQKDNETGIYYETWSVHSDPGLNATVWFESYDCSQFVHRTYKKLTELGAKLSSRSQTNYTKIYLYSGEPTYLGNDSAIFGQPALKNLAEDIRGFYHTFRPHQSFTDFAISLLEAYKKTERKSMCLFKETHLD